MRIENGLRTARIPGQTRGATVEYYVAAYDNRDNSAYDPPDYQTKPYRFRIVSGDFNGDGRTSLADILALLYLGLNQPSDPAADFNGDGQYSLADVRDLLADLIRSRR
jgi:hypothetical protein